MKKTKVTSFWLAIVLVFSFLISPLTYPDVLASPAGAGGTVKAVIANKSGETISLRMWGPKSYALSIKKGKVKIDVEPGKYQVSYQACGATRTGTFEVKKAGDQLLIDACGSITIISRVDGTLTLKLSGPGNYTFYIQSGKTKVRVLKGSYQYSGTGCGSNTSGTISIKKNNVVWDWWCY